MTASASPEDLKDGLIEMINDEIEAYGEDSGWSKFSKKEINAIINRYLNEVTDEELDNFIGDDEEDYGDREGAIMCYINEWADADDLINF